MWNFTHLKINGWSSPTIVRMFPLHLSEWVFGGQTICCDTYSYKFWTLHFFLEMLNQKADMSKNVFKQVSRAQQALL